MILNYVKTAFRILQRYKSYSIISITGLSVGFTFTALLLLLLLNELSYDTFHKNADSIYRISTVRSDGNKETREADAPPPLAELIRSDFPEIDEVVRIRTMGENALGYKEQLYWGRGLYVEPSFTRVFTFPAYEGDLQTALAAPRSIILTRPMAERIFSRQNPVGESIQIDGEAYEVNGLIEAVPENSHIQFDYLLSWSSYEQRVGDDRQTFLESWYYGTSHTYILASRLANRQSFESRLSNVVNTRIDRADFTLDFILQPLTDIYLYSDLDFEIGPTGNVTLLLILGFLVLVILGIVSINYINLATAFVAPRMKEIAVRKTLGARPRDFKLQFIGETLLICLFALAVAIPLIELVLPFFTRMTGATPEIHYLEPGFIGGYLLLTLVIGVVAGIYPALNTARQDPFNATHSAVKSGRLRKILVASQFCITAILLMTSLGINRQLSYMTQKDPGFDPENVIVIRNRDPRAFSGNFENFKQKLLSHPAISHVTATTGRGPLGSIPGTLSHNAEETDIEWMGVDPDFIDLFNIHLLNGRNFSGEYSTDNRRAFVINETAAREMGLNTPVGTEVTMAPLNRQGQIIGVVKDFHYNSLHERIKPLAMIMMSRSAASFISVKIAPDNYREAIPFVETAWDTFAEGQPLDHIFINQQLEHQYAREEQYVGISNFASILAIVLSCMGLFGLVVFMIAQRVKEIGIRKVLGANVGGLIVLLTREYLLLAAAGIIVAIPAVYYGLTLWLQQFAYKTDIGIGIFLISAVIILAIALITVGGKTIQAATTQPVQSLRSE